MTDNINGQPLNGSGKALVIISRGGVQACAVVKRTSRLQQQQQQ
jgi:hypothetical protein